ncbi:DDE superfamily endonuclease [Popillia japonica]|uniref:DDE superfamily endonuclease n=1 Tax=Popillia japonica TaxID=7064 RepID=A0AAW1N4L9_POPJA
MDNAPTHTKSIAMKDQNIKIIFLPSNAMLSLQPLDHGISGCAKAIYTSFVFEKLRIPVDIEPELQIMDCWKTFTIADAITFIKTAINELKPETIKSCWKNLWVEVASDFEDLQ